MKRDEPGAPSPPPPAADDPERARIRQMLIDRGVLPNHITESLIDFWIIEDAKDEEEGHRIREGQRFPSAKYYGGGH